MSRKIELISAVVAIVALLTALPFAFLWVESGSRTLAGISCIALGVSCIGFGISGYQANAKGQR